jgi:DNA-binding GntR family transcriptional regulator
MYTVREALESYAAAEAAPRITRQELDELGRLWNEMREIARRFRESGKDFLEPKMLHRYLQIDMEFHDVVIHAAGNRLMMKILDGTRLLARVFASTYWVYDRTALAEANRFHGRLLRALRAHDAEAGRRWTIEAMRVSKRNALAQWNEHRDEHYR